MKYPRVLLYRHEIYNLIDNYIKSNEKRLEFDVLVVSDKQELYRLYDLDQMILITYGELEEEYIAEVNSVITNEMRKRWLHFRKINDIDEFNRGVLSCFFYYITNHQYDSMRRIFSVFTTCYNSYDKIYRAYESLKNQILKDWEWVIVDDSPDEKHFYFLKNVFDKDHRVRLYKRNENSGNIGNVKNEAVSLCRGKYVLELDHDDEILPHALSDAAKVFDSDSDIGFIYMDFFNIYENGNNFSYGDHYGLGYAGYYRQKYKDKWVFVSITPNINNITLGHIVGVPNHPRIWRKKVLLEIGNYSEFLPVADDYELLLRTSVKTKIAKIPKMSYVQYMNAENNNFSLIRNAEIQKLVHHLKNHCFSNYKIEKVMKSLDAFEEKNEPFPIWKRKNYTHKYCNSIINLDYDKQFCIIGIETLKDKNTEIAGLYKDQKNDFLVLDNNISSDQLCIEIDSMGFDRMKCYSMLDCSDDELKIFFHLMYKNCKDVKIYERQSKAIEYLVYN